MRNRGYGISRGPRTMIGVLVAVSICAMLLPSDWTGGLISIVQVLVPFQHAATASTDTLAGTLDSDAAPVDANVHRALELERDALLHENASLTLRLDELQKEVSLLTATRLWGGEDQRIGARGRLIPARVVTSDILTWRSSRLINAGSLQGVRDGAAVVSRMFSIDRGTEDGVRSGMAILLAEVLVGFVEQVGTHTARVKLLSDVTVEKKVRIGRFTDDGFVALDRFFWLVGRGGSVMELRDVDRRDVEAGIIAVGDVVLSDHTSGTLPAPMTIGTISAIVPDREKPLLSIARVRASLEVDSLRRVYVFDPLGGGEDAEAVEYPPKADR